MRLLTLFFILLGIPGARAQTAPAPTVHDLKKVEIKIPDSSQIVITTDPRFLKQKQTGPILIPDSSQIITETDPRFLKPQFKEIILTPGPSQIVTETDPAHLKLGTKEPTKTNALKDNR